MAKLQLSFGCWDYDRTRALMDGSVQPDGIDLNYLNMPVEETFFRMIRHGEFDVAEMSLSSYTVSLFKDPKRFIAIPIFPSRFFRHSCIYVNTRAGIESPKYLIGKRVGVPEFQMTAPVWIRGILAEHYRSGTIYLGCCPAFHRKRSEKITNKSCRSNMACRSIACTISRAAKKSPIVETSAQLKKFRTEKFLWVRFTFPIILGWLKDGSMRSFSTQNLKKFHWLVMQRSLVWKNKP